MVCRLAEASRAYLERAGCLETRLRGLQDSSPKATTFGSRWTMQKLLEASRADRHQWQRLDWNWKLWKMDKNGMIKKCFLQPGESPQRCTGCSWRGLPGSAVAAPDTNGTSEMMRIAHSALGYPGTRIHVVVFAPSHSQAGWGDLQRLSLKRCPKCWGLRGLWSAEA